MLLVVRWLRAARDSMVGDIALAVSEAEPSLGVGAEAGRPQVVPAMGADRHPSGDEHGAQPRGSSNRSGAWYPAALSPRIPTCCAARERIRLSSSTVSYNFAEM
jgi:hypothetical protein